MRDGSPSIQRESRRPVLVARFAAWVAVVLAILVGPTWSMAGHPVVDVVWNTAGVTIMLLLLETTPAGAIRLPRSLSWVIVIAGAFWLLAARGRPGAVVVFVGLVAALHAERQSSGADRTEGSAWPIAPYLWHAVMWVGTRPGAEMTPLSSVEETGALFTYFSGLVGLVIAMMCLKRPGHGARAAGWVFWFAACAATVVLAVCWPSPP